MEYSRIVAVTGLPGLYEILSSKSDGAIVRSLEDGSTKFVSSRVHNLSHLESIEIYTTGENVALSDIFTAMKNSSEALPDVKDNKALKGYFEKVYPEMDFERVYTSDMKKMVNWSVALQKHDVDFTPTEQPEEEAVEAEVETPEEKAPKAKKAKGGDAEENAEKPVKTATAKKAAAKKESADAPTDSAEGKEAPKKKAPAKKKKAEE